MAAWFLRIFLILGALLVVPSHGYRIIPSIDDPVAATRAVFEPYVKGGVGYFGDPANPDPERVNEGAPFSPDTPRIYLFGSPKQNCPGTIGPINEEEYYCHGREYGYCDRRSGLCVCNQGYAGLDCTDCKPSYFKKGNLCYPKKSCPRDCSEAGVCDYETGTCTCALNRDGIDCARVSCHFDTKCTSCTATACLSCIEGYFVEPATQTCTSCKTYDPRCLVCDASRCLQCADPLLNSVRRSGARKVDSALPFDELTREFSFKFSYGSHDPRVFDEAESFDLLPSSPSPSSAAVYLNESSIACIQGQRMDASWSCQPNAVSHRVCGHAGVFSFTSPIYAVPETAQNITLTVQRSGGGMGEASVAYDVQHVTTTSQDVTPTAFYTSTQVLLFANGVVNMSFLLTIHDDHVVDGNKSFRVALRSPSDGSFLGNQREAHVTIVDNDLPQTDAALTYVVPVSGTTLEKGGFAGDPLTFQIQSVLGDGSASRVGGDLLLMESYVADEAMEMAIGGSLYRPKMTGQLTDHANGTYKISWQRKHAGLYTVAVYLLYPGGLQGDYYADSWLSTSPVVSRIDRQLNFTWNQGPVFPGASDYVSVRWSGRLEPKATGDTTFYVDCDDHVRLWLGDVLLIDRWSFENDGGVQAQATMVLDATVFYALQIEYRDLTGDARISLSWSVMGFFPKEVIPASNLYTAQHIHGSPFTTIAILPAPESHPLTTYLQGAFATVAGTPLILQLFPVDAYGNPRHTFDAKTDLYEARLNLVNDLSLGGLGTKTVDCDVAWRHETACFVVTCVPFFSGTHNLNVFVNTVVIAGSPFSVSVQPNKMHPTRSVLSGGGLMLSRVAGTATTVTLETRDLHHNRIYSSSSTSVAVLNLAVRAMHTTKSGAIDAGSVVNNGDGTFTLTYTPRFVGTYLVHITQNGAHIHNSPYSVTVVPNIAIGLTSVATGSGVVGTATTNVQSSLQIQSRDSNGNDLTTGGGVYRVILEHPSKGNVSGTCTDLANSRYSCTYTPKYVGISKLHVGLFRSNVFTAIVGSPFTTDVVGGPALGSLCFVRGTALVSSIAGQSTNFTVLIRDYFDNDKRNAGTETVDVVFVGPAPSTATIVAANTGLRVAYNGDGTYQVHYKLLTKGAYQIQVSVNGVAIHGSPFAMYTYPATAAHATTSIDLVLPTTSAATPPTYYTGSLITTRITTRDIQRNVLESGGSLFEFDAAFRNTTLIENAQLTDESNGTYRFQFTPRIAQNFDLQAKILYPGGLNATFYGSPDLVGHPKLQRVDAVVDFDFGRSAPTFTNDRERFSVQWSGLLLPQFSEIYTIHVAISGGARVRLGSYQLFASLWPRATTQTQAHETIALTANQLVPIEIQFSKPRGLPNASIRVEWSSLSQQRQVIPASRLFTAWRIIDNVPALRIVPSDAHAPSFTAVFPVGSPSHLSMGETDTVVTATAGERFVFHVTARDRFGNARLTGGDRISVLFPQLAADMATIPHITDHSNASYSISIAPKLSGDFTMVVAATLPSFDIQEGTEIDLLVERLRPFFIRQSPFTLRVMPNKPLAAMSTLVGSGVSTATAGIPSTFVIELRDIHANLIQQLIPADKIIVKLRLLADPLLVFDGIYGYAVEGRLAVEYTATATGVFEIVVAILDGVLVQKTTTLRVFPNLASALTSVAWGDGLGPRVDVNTLLAYQIDLRDFYRNPMEVGGNGIAVVIRGPAVVDGDVVDLQNGNYVVQYRLPLAGQYEIQNILANPGRGLVGYYYETTRFASIGLARATHWVDPRLDFDWNANQTMRNYPRIQWRGYLWPRFTEKYTLELSVFPAGAIYIDNAPVIDAININSSRAGSVFEGTVALVGQRLHRIVVEYRSPSQREVSGFLTLRWRSDRQPKEIIPTDRLLPDGQELQPRFVVNAIEL